MKYLIIEFLKPNNSGAGILFEIYNNNIHFYFIFYKFIIHIRISGKNEKTLG